jgi:hypothetical protein
MYERLGANKASTILTALVTTFFVASVVFLKYGERLRERSAFARYGHEAEKRVGSFAKEGGESARMSRSGERLVGERLEELADELAKRREREGQFPGEGGARQVGNLRWW